ncbi:hypothetical protein N9W89_07125 [Hellea sp.]|nr:hypothetical protein [Hellea sp.]
MEILYRTIVCLFGIWLIAVSIIILLYPQKALSALRKFASTNLINYSELILRFIVGLGLFGHAPNTVFEMEFKIAGGFLAMTAIILILIPRRWHHNYALWWADRLKSWQIRLCAPFSIVLGQVLIFLALA